MNDALLLHGVPIYVRHGRPAVEAVGVRAGRVVAVGRLDEVRAALPPSAREQRLEAGAVMPAFIDPHQHAYLVAADPSTDVLYRRATSVDELLGVLAGFVDSTTPSVTSRWLRFHGYEPLGLAELRSPTAGELDRICPDRPLHLISRTFHESVVNTAGLAELGIGAATPDPPGGRIVRDRRGRPTGVLLESASFAAEARSRSDVDAAVLATRLADHGRRLLGYGITRIGDAAVPVSAADALVAVLDEVGVAVHPLLIGASIDQPGFVEGGTAKVLADGGEYCHLCFTPRQARTLITTTLRIYLSRDGGLARALGRRGGMLRRENDGLRHSGIRLAEADLGGLLHRAAAAGSGLAVHAVGNAAVDALLRARAADPGLAAQVPLRAEHAMIVDPELARRFADAGIPLVVQPGFLPAQGRELSVVPLPEPLRLMPFRTLIEAEVPVAFSSDYPATDLNPWCTVQAAVTRQDHTGRVILADEILDVAQALAAHSEHAATALSLTDVGTLAPGSVADLVWCDQDPYRVAPEQLGAVRTKATWRGGRIMYRAAEATVLGGYRSPDT